MLPIVLVLAAGCAHQGVKTEYTGNPEPGVKIKVVDVSNDTGDLFDVDVIGLMWNAMEEALKNDDLLWTSGSSGPVLEMTVHIVKYRASNVVARNLLPGLANTLVVAKYELKSGNAQVASLESRHSISIGGSFRYGAWKKIFKEAGDDVVKELRKKLRH